jgi:hypothetical protein
MSTRTLAEIDADIDRCNWLRTHMHDLAEVLNQDRALARLTAERDALTAEAVAA